jgi:hypothetical protein
MMHDLKSLTGARAMILIPSRLRAHNLVEILISLAILGLLVSLTVQLLRPDNSLEAAGHKVASYAEHLSMVYHRLKAQFGVTPLSVDFDPDPSVVSTGHGVPLFVRNNDATASYRAGNPSYLDYPGNVRVYLQPEQFGFMAGPQGTLNGAGYADREMLLVDVDPESAPGALDDNDVVLLIIDDETGRVLTANELAIEEGLSTATFPPSFYDIYKTT